MRKQVIKKTIYVLLVLIILPLGINITPLRKFFLHDICLNAGGEWSNVWNLCIYPDCAKTSSCRPHYNNRQLCLRLSTGISKDFLFFNLGMPIEQNKDTYTFGGGPNNSNITAVIKNEVVTKLNCGT